MTRIGLTLLLVFALTMAIGAPASWAKETAYGYMIAYSPRDQMVYHTPIITQPSPGVSSSNEEYFMQTSAVLQLESAFQKHLEQSYKIRSRNFTISARVAYKSEEIARSHFNEESGTFRFRGFQLIEVVDFKP